jgi:hypothetical protein
MNLAKIYPDLLFKEGGKSAMSSKILILVAAGALSVALIGAAYAETSASASAHVVLRIDPNISVEAIDYNVDLGTLQTGEVSAPITFRIDANTQAVAISGLVTKLYKGDDPTSTVVTPIDVKQEEGVVIEPEHAKEVRGGNGRAEYVGAGSFNGFEGYVTEQLVFESSQKGRFSQEVDVTPTWFNEDPEKPQGEYSGFVVLYSSVVY